ncbi:hypothetical protein N836_23855 [Leptolyngbya sp. Heron Island J]|uniref:hypothetical protein n=1 Tax=Leptolyngbya sp. Heron Island J TaxID=1385935 RepID=UPI0003B9A2AE|nr:hypothetical protein [Leptolyngbya sp. Heron Island J]ESA33100.1 hypothetical protein N836_23855 [Leptolyngbya sp. Heron Island J]
MKLTQGLAPINLRKLTPKPYLSQLIKGLLCALIISGCRPAPPPAEDIPVTPEPTATAPTNTVVPPPPPPNSYLAHLSPDAANQLASLSIDIVIPTYLTPNMTLANYGVGTEASNPYYWLVYRDTQNRCFAIEYTSGGIGDISLENREPLNIALFGEGYGLYHGRFPNGDEGALPESDLFTDWLPGEDGFYRLIGAGLVNSQDYGQGDCSNITVPEAITIAESLSYLPSDIRTLDVAPLKPEALSEESFTP